MWSQKSPQASWNKPEPNNVILSLFQILSSPLSRREHGYDAVVLLALLVNYRKYEVSILLGSRNISLLLHTVLELIKKAYSTVFSSTHSNIYQGISTELQYLCKAVIAFKVSLVVAWLSVYCGRLSSLKSFGVLLTVLLLIDFLFIFCSELHWC